MMAGNTLAGDMYNVNYPYYGNDLYMSPFSTGDNKYFNSGCGNSDLSQGAWWQVYWGFPAEVASILFINRYDGASMSGRITSNTTSKD